MQEPEQDKTQTFTVLQPGVTISHYRLERLLGSGGFGDVYLAEDINLKRKAALKFLAPKYVSDRDFRARFQREARSAATLSHPNVVTVYEVGEHESHVFIAMEYLQGTELRQLIIDGRLDVDKSVNLIMQIADGLATAHEAGLIHRDIKPGNVIVDSKMRAKLLDFGLAKGTEDDQITQLGSTIGTINYMSPEQSRGEELDKRSDIFSVGIIFYEMLTGNTPFRRNNMPATLHAIAHDDVPPMADFDVKIPELLEAIVRRALEKNPADRYQDLRQFQNDLRALGGLADPSQISVSISAVTTAPKVKSLAVLHLANLGSPDDDFLSYGITEDLIVDLTRIGSVRVAPMRSVLRYKDSDDEIEVIAEKLKVGLILDGSIHRSGSKIRVSAQLIDVKDGSNLWAQRWEESEENLPKIKNALADAISQALDLGETIVRDAQVGQPQAQNAGAYESYLRGKYTFDHKQDKYDVDIALGLYRMALKEEPSLVAARTAVAEVLTYQGRVVDAEEELHGALEIARQKDLKADQARALMLLTRFEARQSQLDQAWTFGQEALALMRELRDLAGEAEVLGSLISILQARADFDEAMRLFDRVLEIGRQLDDQERIGEALKNMGLAYSRKGEFDRAQSLYDEALALAESSENLSLQAACLSNLGNLAFFRGKLDRAFDYYRHSLEIQENLGEMAGRARSRLNMGLVKMQLGQHDEGLKFLLRSEEDFDHLGERANQALALTNISEARLMLGDTEEAIRAAQRALDIGHEINQPLVRISAQMHLGATLQHMKEFEEARQHFQTALSIAESAKITRNIAHIHIQLGSMDFQEGNLKQGRIEFDKAYKIAKEIGDGPAQLLAEAHQGVAMCSEGLANAGIQQVRAVVTQAEQQDDHQVRLHIQGLLGFCLMKYGRGDAVEEGGRILTEALEAATHVGVVPLQTFIRELKDTV